MTKKTLSLLTLICSLFAAYAQAPQVSYHAKNGSVLSASEDSYFYRIITPDQDAPELFKYEEYYSKNQSPKLTASLTKANRTTSKVGLSTSYYENGQVYQIQKYDLQNKLIDTAFTFYDNGILYSKIYHSSKKSSAENEADKLEYILVQDSLGKQLVANGNGTLIIKNLLRPNGNFEQGKLVNHKKNGTWTGKQNIYTFKETWDHDKLITGTTTDTLGQQTEYTQENFDLVPDFPGGITAFRAELVKNFVFPEEAIYAGVKGTLQVEFVVDRDGNMTAIKVITDLGYGTKTAAVDALKRIRHKWSPAYKRGIPTRVKFITPITLSVADTD